MNQFKVSTFFKDKTNLIWEHPLFLITTTEMRKLIPEKIILEDLNFFQKKNMKMK